MQSYLVFRLYGALASWGKPAVGEERHSGMGPSCSALLGLLGAALGIKRDNDKDLYALQRSVQFAIKQVMPTSLLRDYHTTQIPAQNKKARYHTRKQELDLGKLHTVLSSRDYRCDGLWVIAVSLTADSVYTLEQLQQALLNPVYSLCLGRKSCPPGLPLSPVITEVCPLKQALDTSFPPMTSSHKSDRFWFGHCGLDIYLWQGNKNALGDVGPHVVQTVQAWDIPINRRRWQFTQGLMYQVSLPVAFEEE